MNKKFAITFIVTFIVFFLFNGYFDFSSYELDKVYLTVSTFLFSVFNGFFISRQSSRYSEIRNSLSRFDADMSIIFRESTHLNQDEHSYIREVIATHYKTLLLKKDWAYYFTHKSNLVSSLHEYIGICGAKDMDKVRGEAIRVIMKTLDDIQMVRKTLVSLKEETIPKLQQIFIYVLAAILFMAILTLPSQGLVLASVLKSIYMLTVVIVVVLLKKFDNLTIFEGTIGEHSAKDMLGIIEGEK